MLKIIISRFAKMAMKNGKYGKAFFYAQPWSSILAQPLFRLSKKKITFAEMLPCVFEGRGPRGAWYI